MCLYWTLDCVWDSSENMPMYCEYSFEVLAILNSFMQTDLIMQLLNSGEPQYFGTIDGCHVDMYQYQL